MHEGTLRPEERELIANAAVALRRVQNGCPNLPEYARRPVGRFAALLEREVSGPDGRPTDHLKVVA